MMSCVNHAVVITLLLFAATSIVLLCYYDNARNDSGELQNDTLVMVHVVVRHGDRTPDYSYPTDIYRNETYSPFGLGALTSAGRRRASNVGKELRERYDNFLGPEYYPKALAALSSENPRCRLSLEELLASLFPLEREPVAYDFALPQQDHLISTYTTCPLIWDAEMTDPNHTCEDFDVVQGILRENTGWPIEKPSEIYKIGVTLQLQEDFGLQLPDWAKPIWREPLVRCTQSLLRAISDDKRILSYAVGNLLRKILEDSYAKLNGSRGFAESKISIYSGHDMSIAGLLGAVDLYFGQEILFSEYLIYELHNVEGTAGFKVYQRNYKSDLKLLDIPNCGMFCPLDKLYELVLPLFPSVWCK